MSYSDYALIKKSTLIEIGDAIRSQKGTTELIDPADFGSEISAIETGSSVEGGFTVNFHNTDGELIESHSAELGRDIYAPASFNEVNYWSDENGVPYTLPLTINEADTVLDLYATEAQTCARVLYAHFGVDSAARTDICVDIQADGNYVHVYFGNGLINGASATERLSYTLKNVKGTYASIMSDMLLVVNALIATPIANFTTGTGYVASYSTHYYYPNFDMDWGIVNGRLDEVMYESNDRLHPYALQEKTVTENGDVVPDEGYYGLSKVTVDVESGASIDGGYTVNFYNASDELIDSHSTACGMYIDKPISYDCEAWIDADGRINEFPLTITTFGMVRDLYPSDINLCSDVVYAHCGVDKEAYPYMLIMAETTYNDIRVIFSDNIKIASDGVTINACKYVDRLTNDILSSGDLSMKNCMKALKYQAVTLQSTSYWGKNIVDSTLYYYTNFDSVITTDRLDKCVY